jgi:hypothetical protein
MLRVFDRTQDAALFLPAQQRPGAPGEKLYQSDVSRPRSGLDYCRASACASAFMPRSERAGAGSRSNRLRDHERDGGQHQRCDGCHGRYFDLIEVSRSVDEQPIEVSPPKRRY